MIHVNAETGCWQASGGGARSPQLLRVLATGDICPMRGWRLDACFAGGAPKAAAVYGDVLPQLADKDLSVTNLELTLSEKGEPIIKDGPVLQGPPAAIEGIVAGQFDAAVMANNHVLDMGPEALLETIALVRSRGVAVVGAGENLADASKLVVLERRGVRVGLLAFAENEFCNATPTTPGGAALQPGPNVNIVRRSREACDLLIVFVHGGNEFCPFPSPRMVRDYRALVDAGADAVIGHHPHTVQGVELHAGVPIVYSLGNFLFWADPKEVPATWWLEMFARLHFDGRRCVRVDVHPVDFDPRTVTAKLSTGTDKRAFLTRLNRLSQIIADRDLHQRFWSAYCLTRMQHYLDWIKDMRQDIESPQRRRHAAARLKNLFSCEAHCEVLVTGLELIRQGRDGDDFAVGDELSRFMGDAR